MTSLRYPVAGLILVFLLAFGIFLVALMPAAVMTPLLPTPATDNASLQPPKLYGLWWNGQGQAQWEGQQLDITWRLDWRGLTPGLELGFESGQVNAPGGPEQTGGTGVSSIGKPVSRSPCSMTFCRKVKPRGSSIFHCPSCHWQAPRSAPSAANLLTVVAP